MDYHKLKSASALEVELLLEVIEEIRKEEERIMRQAKASAASGGGS